MEAAWLDLHQRSEPLGRGQVVTARGQFGHLFPVDLADVQAQRHPTVVRHIRGQVEAVGLRFGESRVVAWQHLATDRHYAIAMMVVEEPGESLLSDEKTRVPALATPRSLGQRASSSHAPKQYSLPSCEPITTRPPAIAGEAESGAPASNSHTFFPVARSST